MTCQACTAARASTLGEYRNGCHGCTARSIARDPAAWNALHKDGNGDRKPLTEMVNILLADMDAKEARKLVLDWWRHDHEGTA